MSPRFQLLALLSLFAFGIALSPSCSAAGGISGGGGDACERRVGEIRADLLSWIENGGAVDLNLPPGMSFETYTTGMAKVLIPHAVIVGCVSTEEEKAERQATAARPDADDELLVDVDGQPKTCRGFASKRDHLPHILCNIERFTQTSQAEQYRLVHHEYAGLAGLERNIGASSDYTVSDQLTDFLTPETILRLAVKKPVEASQADPDADLLSEAKAQLDSGDCKGALVTLQKVVRTGDESFRLTGWANLCISGVTASKLATSLFSYVKGGSLSLMGALANSMIPAGDANRKTLWAAIAAFSRMTSATDDQRVTLAMTSLSQAATIIAKASADGAPVKRADIAPPSCLNSDCAAGGAGCSARSMSDADATAVGIALLSAQAESSGFPGTFGDLTDALGNIASDSNPNSDRCAIYNYFLTE